MKRILTGTLTWILLMALPLSIRAVPPQNDAALKATATAHGINYTWTASVSTYSGLGYNLYIATTSGGEGATPANSALLTGVCTGTACAYTYSNVTPLSTYYAKLAACVPNAGSTTCSPQTSEVAATIPLGQADINAPTGFGGSAF